MSRPFIPFALPDIGEAEIEEAVDSLRSGWVTTGPKTRRFEEVFAEYLGGGVETVAVNSATAGLHLALEAIGIGPGDEVITTTHTFTATAEVVRYLGADPVFVDIDLASYCIDPGLIEAAITPRTRAIIPVHFAGLACDMDAILDIARRRGLRVVEDAAHALPTRHRGRLIGTLDSDATVFSFYANKTMTTGEGGMLVTRDPDLARRARVMRLHGIDRDAFDRYSSTRPAWYYQVVDPGFKYNLTDLASALGIHQLARVEAMHSSRARQAARYGEALAGLPLVLPPGGPGDGLHAWHLYVIRLEDSAGVSRDAFIQSMAEAGIGCSVHYIPLHLHPYWRARYGLAPDRFPMSQRLYERCVSLPLYSRLASEDQAYVIETVGTLLT